MVSGSFSRKTLRISLCAGWRDGVKDMEALEELVVLLVKTSFQVSVGDRCGCCDLILIPKIVSNYFTYTAVHTSKAIDAILFDLVRPNSNSRRSRILR